MRYLKPHLHISHFVAAIIVVIISLTTASVAAQANDSLRYEAELHTTVSAGQNTPFWLVNNLQGLGSVKKNNGWVRAGLFRDIDTKRRFSWGAGAEIVAGWNVTAPFQIHQLYGEVKYRSLGVMLGSKEIWGDYNNPRLSSGNLLFSGNAMPIPQLRIGLPQFAPFWGTNGWFSVKTYLSFGMFTDSAWQKSWAAPGSQHTKNVLFHSKGLWLRGGKPDVFPLVADVGIEMATQFGGKSFKDGKWISMPHRFKDWLKAVIPFAGGSDTPIEEQTNVQGNMVGAYNIAIQWIPEADWSIKAYFEHYFEDHSQMTFEYGWKDGLWGIETTLPKNPFVTAFVYEFLYSKDQTGAVNHDWSPEVPEQVSGRDGYYTHYLYNGWQHWGMGIGNPLALAPIYNANHEITFANTRIIAHHIGIEGSPHHDISYRALFTFSKNWGTYWNPYPDVLNSFNSLIEITWRPKNLEGWRGTIALAADSGDLLGKSFGMMLSIGKTGSIGLNRKKNKTILP